MNDLLVQIFDDEYGAARVLNTLRRDNPGLKELQQAAYVERDSEGVTRLHQGSQLTPRGPVAGAWTSLIGLLLASAANPAAPMQLADQSIDDAFARQVAIELAPGRSALFALLIAPNADEVRGATAPFGGAVLEVTLSRCTAARLRRSLQAGSRHCQSA